MCVNEHVCVQYVLYACCLILLLTRTVLTAEPICKELEQTWGEFLSPRPLPLHPSGQTLSRLFGADWSTLADNGCVL